MKSVLIVSTCYDVNSYYTSRWAANLHTELVKHKNTISLHYDATTLCRAGSALQEAVSRVDYVVFYGHGTKDEWIALPEVANVLGTTAASALVDLNTVDVLKEKKVYAGCCWSLKGLGKAHSANSAKGEFVGYDQEFDFEYSNATRFEEVVKQSVISYINGTPAADVAKNLRERWTRLRDDFGQGGELNNSTNSAMAYAAADRNRHRVGSLP
jgi:hypothetical protein